MFKRLSIFSLIILLLFFFTACGNDRVLKVNITAPDFNDPFLTPCGLYFRPADFRPKAYNVYSASGELVESFSSLYQGIAFAVKNLEPYSYIENIYYPGKKVFIHTPVPHCFFYKNGTTLENYISWLELDDYNAYQDAVCVINSPQYPAYHSFKYQKPSQDLESGEPMPYLDAYVQKELNGGAVKVNLTLSKIYPPFSQSVYAKIGFAVLADGLAYFTGLACDAGVGDWHYCFDSLENTALDTDQCVLTSEFKDGYFVPQDDVLMTIENAGFQIREDQFSQCFITLTFSQGRRYKFQHLLPGKVNKAYFIAAFDILSEGVTDYMNGARWENVEILHESQNALIYNTAAVKNKGQDAFDFSYDFDPSQPVYSAAITQVQNKIDRIKQENLTQADAQSVLDAIKAFNALPQNLRRLLPDAHKLRSARDELYGLYSGLEKAKIIAQTLLPVLEADNGYIIDNYQYIYEAWDILYNQTAEQELEEFSQYYKTKITAYYHKAINLYTQAVQALIAIDRLKPDSPKEEIIEAYEKYIVLDEHQKQKILGVDFCGAFENILKSIDQPVLDAISKIMRLGRHNSSDYPLVYGVNNYNEMQSLIQSYEALNSRQKKLIPPKYKKIYQTASKYFKDQTGYLKKLKSLIQENESPTKQDILVWVEIFNKLDVASKWSFKHDSRFGGERYYQKLIQAAVSYDIKIE